MAFWVKAVGFCSAAVWLLHGTCSTACSSVGASALIQGSNCLLKYSLNFDVVARFSFLFFFLGGDGGGQEIMQFALGSLLLSGHLSVRSEVNNWCVCRACVPTCCAFRPC